MIAVRLLSDSGENGLFPLLLHQIVRQRSVAFNAVTLRHAFSPLEWRGCDNNRGGRCCGLSNGRRRLLVLRLVVVVVVSCVYGVNALFLTDLNELGGVVVDDQIRWR